MRKRTKKLLRVIKQALNYTFLCASVIIGIFLYRVFLGYVPGVNIADLFILKTGIQAFPFFGICAGICISFPFIIIAFEIYYRFSTSYISFITENGFVHLSDTAIAGFIKDVVAGLAGVETVEATIEIFKENRLGIHIWLDTDEKSDFVRFSERVQQRVLQDLDFNFGIKKIKYFHVYIESTNINTGTAGYKVDYH